MKLVTYRLDGAEHIGALVDDDRIVALDRLITHDPSSGLRALLELGRIGLDHARSVVVDTPESERIPLASVRLMAPIPRPSKFFGVGGNFTSHIAEVAHLGFTNPKHPIFFNKQVTCVAGPFDEILAPRDSVELDYEGELGLVIGRRARRLSVDDALDAVAGFVVGNDVSVRDWQLRAPTSTVGKSYDSHGPFGPALVTRDEVGDPGDLRIRTWVNGELRQDGSTSEMIFDCAELVADLSRFVTLEVGDVIFIGSPAGVGGLRTPPQFLVAGDVVRVEIDGVGAIENTVVDDDRAPLGRSR